MGDHDSTEKSEFDIDDLIEKLGKQEPILSFEQVEQLENRITETGITRRAALALLTKSPTETSNAILNNQSYAETIAELSVCIKDSLEYYRGLTELMETSHLWLNYALAGREDMNELLAKAENS
jgi:hypothetical protein